MYAQSAPQQTRSILTVISDDADPVFLSALRELGNVRTVRSLAEAAGILRNAAEPVDVFVARRGDAAALLGELGPQRAETILNRIGQGVCIVNASGGLAWANPKLRAYPPDVLETVRSVCARLCAEIAAERGRQEHSRQRRRSIQVADLSFDLAVSALPGGSENDEIDEVVGLVWDVTGTRKLQEKINAIDEAGRELVRLEADRLAVMDVGERLKLLEDMITRYCRDLMHFNHFTVRVLDRKTNRLDTAIAGGFSEEAKSLDIYAAPEGNGISGYVAATGRSYICPDVSKDPRYLPGIDRARSTLTVPLRLHDQIVGVFNIESDQIAAFNEDDRQFAEIFGRNIATALHILSLLAVERGTTMGQIASDVAAELSGPLNDIITDASHVLEEFIGHDDARRRLNGIIDNVDRLKRAINNMTVVRGLIPEKHEDPVIGGKRVLVAEDEEVIRETVVDILTRSGAKVEFAEDGTSAMAKLASGERFDLVLSDIKMPLHTGYEVFAAAKAANPNCPVVLITGFGYDPDHSIVRASKEGLAGVLFKPFKVDQLLETVRKALTA
ncbi:Response regulator receiver protein [Phycisphaerae bacterium RAS1]|nr:Response regulator receiver protein [Phycisphaerae bacterium RAS1]